MKIKKPGFEHIPSLIEFRKRLRLGKVNGMIIEAFFTGIGICAEFKPILNIIHGFLVTAELEDLGGDIRFFLEEQIQRHLSDHITNPHIRSAFNSGNFIGTFPNKKSAGWQSILPYSVVPFREDPLVAYKTYPLHSGDFEKYYRIRGPMLINDAWREKFRHIGKIPETMFWKHYVHLPIPDEIMSVFEECMMQKKDAYWPLMTTIINHATVRSLNNYPLTSVEDILRLDYASSFILEEAERKKFLRHFVSQFFSHTKNDIKAWRESICQLHPEYRPLLEEGDVKRQISSPEISEDK